MLEERKPVLSRVPAIVSIVMLGISFLGWPIGFYTVLRIIVTGSAIYYGYQMNIRGDSSYWFWLFVLIAILFNPLIPIHLGDKATWQVIDWLTIGYLAMFMFSKLPKLSNNNQ